MKKLSLSMENYLEAVYELSLNTKGARLTDIACKMRVTKASANNAMSVLAEKGLVVNERYQLVCLTEEGFARARFTSQKHEIIYKFFTLALKMNPATADIDACTLEHLISDDAVHAMYNRLLETGSVANINLTNA